MRLKPDRKLHIEITIKQEFFGAIANRQHIGKNGDQLVALWNAEHSDDPVA